MTQIRKQTTAGDVVIEVSYRGCENVRAILNGKEIGAGVFPLKAKSTINGKVLVASCGKLGLTDEDMANIAAAMAIEQSDWAGSDAGKACAGEAASWERKCARAEEILRNGDITKWADA